MSSQPRTPGRYSLRAAITGCGKISSIHIDAVRAMPGVEIVGVCDQNQSEARKRALQAGTDHIFADMETMMKEVRPNVVHLLTPPRTHFAT